MTLRSPRERIVQTLCYEVGGLALATPVYVAVAGSGGEEGAIVIAAMAVAVLLWSPVHNTLWDMVELRLTGRVASDRPQGQRILHAVSHEATALILTLPILMILGGHDLWTALLLDIGFTLFYAVYAYAFHIVFDWARPVRPLLQARVQP